MKIGCNIRQALSLTFCSSFLKIRRGVHPIVKIGAKKMEYTVLVYKAGEGGYRAEVPALPGCYSQGETIEETMKNIKEAIESHKMVLK
ncbi:MAG: type II toxin-antitoxin system HicB family antitoxin [Candidatus Methanoperedens sp.]|nr:type II toxin-antitoxin system HicB family antitoxin [Candidatus Methanoperedens sp.]MCZ7404626.1 type II toxin-antitoxin system HicB family antitoxin [Candidatus Methanoperedens sp.]